MIRFVPRALVATLLLVLGAAAVLEVRTRLGAKDADAQFEAQRPTKLRDWGATRSVSILPLIDWHRSDPELRTEMGVSYLIETDDHRILFDVGHNARRESPSPLEHNMSALGVGIETIDTIFISHNPFDHVGGRANQRDSTFSIGLEPAPLPDARIFVPIPMTYPGSSPEHSPDPTRIGNGVASTGTIPRQLVFGWIDEQALVVNVEGRGAVLVVGCGHQTIPRLLARYDEVFELPLYGIVGGLHYPVPDGRLTLLGLNAQRVFASGRGMLAPLTMEDVRDELAMLERRELGLLGLGGHDSSDEVITMFSDAFGAAYRPVRVGERIVVSAPNEPLQIAP